MSEVFQLEVPEFASLLRQCDPNGICNECCDLLSSCAANLGILNTPVNPTPECVCHDICVEEVTLICAKPVNCTIPYPPIGRCRLGNVPLPPLPNNTICNVFVTCADEVLDAGCQSVSATIGLLIVCGTVVVPTCFTIQCNTFTSVPDCTAVTGLALQQQIKEIDGSCLVIQVRAVTNADGTAIILTGKVIEKLWKHQNLMVVGLRPYDLNDAERADGFISITVSNEFNALHKISPCSSSSCPSCS